MKAYKIFDVYPNTESKSYKWRSETIFLFDKDGNLEDITWFEISHVEEGVVVEIGDPTGDRWPVPAEKGYWCYPFNIFECEKIEIQDIENTAGEREILTVDKEGNTNIVELDMEYDNFIYHDYPELRPAGWKPKKPQGPVICTQSLNIYGAE